MKMIFAAFTFIVSSSASAMPAQVFMLKCSTKSTAMTMTIMNSSADGVFVSDVVFKDSGKSDFVVANLITDTEPNGNVAPKRLSFYKEGRLVELRMSTDAISAALGRNMKATISVDGKISTAQCRGTETI